MKLSDIFDQLAYGELSQLSLVNDQEIIPDDYNRVISQVNMGLTELHKRFMLKRKTLTLRALEDVLRYPLRKSNSVSGGSQQAFIIDADDPFQEDIIEVLSVHGPKGEELPLNVQREVEQLSVFTPGLDIVRFNVDPPLGDYTVTYKASHPVIPKVVDPLTFDASHIDIELPMAYLEALLFYIASRVTTPIVGGMNGNPSEGMTYAQRFEQACQTLLYQGLDVEVNRESTRFSQNGFV